MPDGGAELALAARLWPAVAFALAWAALLWLAGLTRLHGAMAAAPMLALLHLGAGWPAAAVAAIALALAGLASRLAPALGADEQRPGIVVVPALTGVAAVAAWGTRVASISALADVALTAALAGGVAVWCARSAGTRFGDARGARVMIAGGVAFLLAAVATESGLIGPGDGILAVLGGLAGLAVPTAITGRTRGVAIVAASLVALVVAVALAVALP